ncbi:DUF7003 family protein [Streptomyces sp. NRRL WC-3725]|uniref:DUF7003 family protein n=1 Tax=Streptomyces sp. NRRL WC-3725 TaxID=1463933 RepID=UPI000A63470C|nr:hypothetical protein [Streptomyces sp. NRRL WC-3725]
MMTTAAILDQFDQCADEAVFPDLANGYYYPVDVRLSLFHGPGEWGMVAELLGYSPRAGNLTDVLHVFGNCLTRGEPGFCNDDFFDRIENIDELTEDGRSYRGSRFARVRGRKLPLTGQEGEPLVDILRSLVLENRSLFLANDQELRNRLPARVPLILQLNEWQQPHDLGDSMPSDHETFRRIAEVLATGDASRCRPQIPSNTHWSAWPEAGTL